MIVPAYDEEQSVGRVLDEWLAALRALGTPFRVLAIDDGSRDGTLEVLRRTAAAHPEVTVLDQANAGHGQACLRGYRAALAGGAEWVLQIDSDGQCDPAFLPALWAARRDRAAVFGRRVRRDDGAVRRLASRAVSVVVWLATRVWVVDANVPYRLMRRDALAAALAGVPEDFALVNVLLAVRLQEGAGIRWVPIRFRGRLGGAPSARLGGLLAGGARLYRQLRRVPRRRPRS